MPDFLKALQSGGTSLWLFIPTAIPLVILAIYMAVHGWQGLGSPHP